MSKLSLAHYYACEWIHNSFKPQLVDVNIVHPKKVKKKYRQDLKRKDKAA